VVSLEASKILALEVDYLDPLKFPNQVVLEAVVEEECLEVVVLQAQEVEVLASLEVQPSVDQLLWDQEEVSNSLNIGQIYLTHLGMFGQSTTSSQKSTFFGDASSTSGSVFGGQSTGFGSQNTGGFGSSGGNSARLEEGTVSAQFNGYKDKDHGSDHKTTIHLNSITADPKFNCYSLEELRAADYILKKQGKCNFPIGAQPGQNTASTPSFGGSGGGGMFGSNNSQSPFGGSSAGSTIGKPSGIFGASTGQSTFGKSKFTH